MKANYSYRSAIVKLPQPNPKASFNPKVNPISNPKRISNLKNNLPITRHDYRSSLYSMQNKRPSKPDTVKYAQESKVQCLIFKVKNRFV